MLVLQLQMLRRLGMLRLEGVSDVNQYHTADGPGLVQ
jgi:hypothetical protein